MPRQIARESRYVPLIAWPHPNIAAAWQLLDGEQRSKALARLGYTEALVFPWPCDDPTALLLLATFNRLEGDDVPLRRAELLVELNNMLSIDEMATLLPKDAATITGMLSLLDLDAAGAA